MGKSVEEPKKRVVSMRVTDEEFVAIEAMAKAFKLPISEVVRSRVVESTCACCGKCRVA